MMWLVGILSALAGVVAAWCAVTGLYHNDLEDRITTLEEKWDRRHEI